MSTDHFNIKTADHVQQKEKSTTRKKKKRSTHRAQPLDTFSKDEGGDVSDPLGSRGLAAVLNTLEDDISTISKQSQVLDRTTRAKLSNEPTKIMLPLGESDYREPTVKPTNQDRQTIYIEKCAGFRTEHPLRERRHQAENTQNRMTLLMDDKPEITNCDQHQNDGLTFALKAYKFSRLTGLILFGLLAGASLAHTLFVQSLLGTNIVDSNGWLTRVPDSGVSLIGRYGLYAEPTWITMYILFIISGTYIMDRNDFARPTGSCMARCATFGNGSVATLFILIAFILHNTMFSFTCVISKMAIVPTSSLTDQISQNENYQFVVSIWPILDACRTAFILTAWLVVGVTAFSRDRAIELLLSGPGEPKCMGDSGQTRLQ